MMVLCRIYFLIPRDEQRRSLGVFAILNKLNMSKTLSLIYLYLGFLGAAFHQDELQIIYLRLLLDGQWHWAANATSQTT